MKKLLFLFGCLVTSLFVFNIISKASPNDEIMPSYSNNELKSCLGKSIDVIQAKNYGDIANSSILDYEYYRSLEVCDNNYYKSSKSYYISSNSSEEVKYKINSNYSYDMNLSGYQYKGFTLGASTRFNIGCDIDYSKYVSRSFVEYVGEVNKGKLYLPYGYSNQDEFKEHLSNNFKSALTKLKNGQISYEYFFTCFGTHIITSYVYGDRLYLDSYCVSNEKMIDNRFAMDLAANADASFLNLSGSVHSNLDFNSNYKLKQNYSKFECKISCASGMLLSSSSDAIEGWVDHVNSNTFYDTIVEYCNDSFVPIWEVLPEDSPISSLRMQIEFNNYRKKYCTSYEEGSYKFNVESYDHSLGGRTIKDKDRFNYINEFNVCEKYGFNVVKNAFDYIVLTITIQAKRIDDGNQLFYIYNKQEAINKKHEKYLYES